MQPLVLLLGGNEPNTRFLFGQAGELVENKVGEVVGCSSLYRSTPWGFEHDSWFLNQVLVVHSCLLPLELLVQTQEIERLLGRKKKTTTHYEGRPIDIDILFIGNKRYDFPKLQVPHPRLHLRRFTLVPLCELMPAFIHPLLGKKMSELLEVCSDDGQVQKVD